MPNRQVDGTVQSAATDIASAVAHNFVMDEPRSPTLLIVGGHPLVAEGIRSLVSQMDIRGNSLYASSATEAVKLLRENAVDLVLLDLADDAKAETLASIREYDDDVPVIVLSVSESANVARGAISATDGGFLADAASLEILREAINITIWGRRIALVPLHSSGQVAAPGSVAGSASMSRRFRDRRANLTGQETRVLAQLAEGLTNKEIARALGILEGTVKVHVKSILRKLDAKNRTVAALMAAECAHGTIPSKT